MGGAQGGIGRGGGGGGYGGGGGGGNPYPPHSPTHKHSQVSAVDRAYAAFNNDPQQSSAASDGMSLVTNDVSMGRDAVVAMGMSPETHDVLSLILTFRPSGSTTKLGGRMKKEERQKLRERFRGIPIICQTS